MRWKENSRQQAADFFAVVFEDSRGAREGEEKDCDIGQEHRTDLPMIQLKGEMKAEPTLMQIYVFHDRGFFWFQRGV